MFPFLPPTAPAHFNSDLISNYVDVCSVVPPLQKAAQGPWRLEMIGRNRFVRGVVPVRRGTKEAYGMEWGLLATFDTLNDCQVRKMFWEDIVGSQQTIKYNLDRGTTRCSRA